MSVYLISLIGVTTRSKKLAVSVLGVILFVQIGLVAALPLETLISQRSSVRSFTSQAVSSQQLLDFLWASYGYAGTNRVVPSIGITYSLTLFTVNFRIPF